MLGAEHEPEERMFESEGEYTGAVTGYEAAAGIEYEAAAGTEFGSASDIGIHRGSSSHAHEYAQFG